MTKLALCIKRADLFALNQLTQYSAMSGSVLAEAPEGFLRLRTTLEDRATCETNPELLQLLPYTLLIRATDNKVFTYCRGKGGAEARLHGNLSIGVGGHVDTDVPELGEDSDLEIGEALMYHLEDSALRELEEETGYNADLDENSPESPTGGDWSGLLLYDDSNPVGQVHLGLLFVKHIEDDSCLGDKEAGIIEGSQWLSKSELLEPAVYDRLENWSKIVVSAITSTVNL